jgi:drug/metabolite transporter (DMT)-like permease
MDVNYGIRTFDSSIRWRDGDLRIAWHFCDASAARREDDRFFYRCLFGAVAMGIYCLFWGHFRAIPKRDLFLAFGTGFLMLGNWVFFFEGILRIGVSVGTIVYQVQPFIVLVAGAFLFQERLGLTKVLLFLAALYGLILAAGVKWNMIDTGYLLGVGFTLLGAILYAGVVLVDKGLKSVKPEIVSLFNVR